MSVARNAPVRRARTWCRMIRELPVVRRPLMNGPRLDNDNCAIDDPLFAWDNAQHIRLTLCGFCGDGLRPARRTADDKRKSVRLVPLAKSQVTIWLPLRARSLARRCLGGIPIKSVVSGRPGHGRGDLQHLQHLPARELSALSGVLLRPLIRKCETIARVHLFGLPSIPCSAIGAGGCPED